MFEELASVLLIALGITLGTVLSWLVSFFMAKKMLPTFIRLLCENEEAVEALRKLMERIGVDVKAIGGWVLRRDEQGRVVEVKRR